MVTINEIFNIFVEKSLNFVPKILLAVVTLVVGLWIIKRIVKLTKNQLTKRNTDEALNKFLESFISVLLKIVLFVVVVGILGVETASFVAVLAAMAFAIGLALQGSLSNLAGGILILFFKPFKLGDFIEAQGESGTVNKIEIFTTTLTTPDNKTIIIPNGPLYNGNITNYTTEPKRRVDMNFGISYDDDIKKAKEILYNLIKSDERVDKEPDVSVMVTQLGDSSVNVRVRAWMDSGDYWPFFWDMQEKVKLKFDEENISIPFPQVEYHQK